MKALAALTALLAVALLAGSAGAYELADFSVGSVHMHAGKSTMARVYVKNPAASHENVSVWLGGDYPAGKAWFYREPGVHCTPDQRNLTVTLNPREERTFSLILVSPEPKSGGGPYSIVMGANTTGGPAREYSKLDIYVDYAPSFPGLGFWGILAAAGLSCLIFYRKNKG